MKHLMIGPYNRYNRVAEKQHLQISWNTKFEQNYLEFRETKIIKFLDIFALAKLMKQYKKLF